MADKQTTTEEEIVVVGPGADDDTTNTTADTDDSADQGYQYADGDDEDSPGRDAGDERTGHADDDAPDNKDGLSENQRRRRRKRARYESDQREMALLRTRNEQLEREHSRRLAAMETRQTQSDVLAIDGRISQAQSNIREAENLYTEALKKNDAESATEALRVRDELRDGLNQLRGAKQQTVRGAQTRQQQANQSPPMDPAIISRAREWASERPWFDPKLGDEYSAITHAVERTVFKEGRLDPRSDEYWDEVDRRLAKRLPERYQDATEEDDREPPRRNGNGRVNGNGPRKASGPTIKVGGRERTLKRGEVFIDEDRKAAMIEAGVWDDPKLREKQLKAYQKYDREAGRRPR